MVAFVGVYLDVDYRHRSILCYQAASSGGVPSRSAPTPNTRSALRMTRRVTNHNSSGMSGEPSCTGVNPIWWWPLTNPGNITSLPLPITATFGCLRPRSRYVPISTMAPSSCSMAPSAISFQRWRSIACVSMARLRIRDADMSGPLGKLRKPVIGNVDPPGDPGVPSVGDMQKNPVEGADAAGPADHSQVQPDRHHLRGMRPLAMQPVEGVDRIRGEIGGAAEPVGMEELHVVGVERVGQYQVPLV